MCTGKSNFRRNFEKHISIGLGSYAWIQTLLFPHAQCRPTGMYLLQTRTGVRENAIFYVQESNCGKMINCPQSKKQDSNPKKKSRALCKRHVNGVCVCVGVGASLRAMIT